MNVILTPALEALVNEKVAAGLYSSPSEVMRDALRLMQEQDKIQTLRLEQLRSEIAQGLASGTSEPWDVGTAKRKLHARRAAAFPFQSQT
ncbi:MAG: type II toxin-antitoxin system ParD family antitoxin [Polaromonas sp.]